ncbi:MAG: UvrD-helicase domain-containing protein, partial [Bacteroidia bacterium]|nr:UvrD-helicase domain-containing protein [Bacteroidia bacterium]
MKINKLKIYRSSAGSGKTRTLVFQYVSLLLKHPEQYRNILAVTFTNKATEEMKDRIIQLLVDLSNKKVKKQDLDDLHNESSVEHNLLAHRAGVALNKILHDYSSFTISTIDSFFNGIIRALAVEMSIPVKYDIELRTKTLTIELIRELYSTLSEEQHILNWLEKYVEHRLEDASNWDPDRAIKKIASEIFTERYKLIPDEDKTLPSIQTLNDLYAIKHGFEKKIREFAIDIKHQCEERGLKAEDFKGKSQGIGNYLLNTLSADSSLSVKKLAINKSNRDSLENGQYFTKPNSEQENFQDEFLIDFGSSFLKFYDDHIVDYITSMQVIESFYLKGVLSFLQITFEKTKKENNFIHISDNNKILSTLISNSNAPFIFERTGNKYFHFLIDEFQDTSSLQWANFKPLVQNSLASGNFSMIVGDAKQSIYRWRGGNMDLLNHTVQNDLSPFKKIIELENLNTNYRSSRDIVEFNNSFFLKAKQLL